MSTSGTTMPLHPSHDERVLAIRCIPPVADESVQHVGGDVRTSVQPAIEVRGVRLTYPARRRQPAIDALRGVDLVIPAGQRVALLGPNGSGKSTLMLVACGLMPRDAGEVRVFGERDAAMIRRSIGIVFQHDSLDPQMSVAENLRDHAMLQGIAAASVAARVDQLLQQVGVAQRRAQRVKTLSRGLARRVDLARAMLHEPRLLMLDEPTVGLDPSAREQFLSLVDECCEARGVTALMNTHLVDEADRQDRVLLMHEGRIVADDAPAALRRSVGARVLTVHDGAWSPADGAREPWKRVSGGWRRAFVDGESEARSLLAQLADANVPFSLAPPTLADVFEHYTGRELDE